MNQRQSDEIRALLERPGAIRPVYQPVVALATGRLVGYEALARFLRARPPHCGLVRDGLFAASAPTWRPSRFRPRWSRWGAHPVPTWRSSVSPSVMLSAVVQDALPDDLSEIVIEVTEHEALSEDEAVREALRELRARRSHRGGRRRRRLLGPEAADPGAAGHRQARPHPHRGHPR